jgi:hypothetical protein
MAQEAGGSEHSVLCLRLLQLFPRVTRGMRRWQDRGAPPAPAPLSPRHIAALEQIRDRQLTVGELASGLGLTMPTVSGVLADLDQRPAWLNVMPTPPTGGAPSSGSPLARRA